MYSFGGYFTGPGTAVVVGTAFADPRSCTHRA
jgi:hypothetical protein